jgi:hypothetical protein
VDIVAGDPLRNEPERMAGGDTNVGDDSKLVSDLGCGVARPDNDDPLAGVGGWSNV